MGILVQCPNGHEFKVKDKYAGKKGICPFCKGQVVVRVPDALSSKEFNTAVHRAAAQDRKTAAALERKATAKSSSVLDDSTSTDSSASSSLLSSSVIRHNVKCQCGESVPMWFAKCPKCGRFMEQR